MKVSGLDHLLKQVVVGQHQIRIVVTWRRFITGENPRLDPIVLAPVVVTGGGDDTTFSHVFRHYGHFAALVQIEEEDVATGIVKKLFTLDTPIVKVVDSRMDIE
jgi:hypothetical protein